MKTAKQASAAFLKRHQETLTGFDERCGRLQKLAVDGFLARAADHMRIASLEKLWQQFSQGAHLEQRQDNFDVCFFSR